MPRHVLTLNDLGEEGSWLLVQQARGIPDAKSRTDFMTERTAVLLFAQDSFAERLCVSAAVRQMGGSLVFQGATGGWKSEVERYQRQMAVFVLLPAAAPAGIISSNFFQHNVLSSF